ncbi:hypothetical protein [Methylocaldum sp.]|uniref:hypothetical protein n=1 Tax=Methylocaldum sp. TaxID=1969727 RepID=UPI00322074C7
MIGALPRLSVSYINRSKENRKRRCAKTHPRAGPRLCPLLQPATAGGQHVHKWVKPNSATRNEVLDCTVGGLCGLEMLAERYRDIDLFWTEMARRLSRVDLFEEGSPEETPPPAAVIPPLATIPVPLPPAGNRYIPE